MIKEIKTNKFEGLAVLVPDGAYWPNLKYVKYSDGKEYFMIDYYFSENHTGGFLLWYKDFGGRKNYPKEGGLQIVGIANSLTEEQCAEIVEEVKEIHLKKELKSYKCYNGDGPFSLTSIKSFSSLMQSLECYSVNPYGDRAFNSGAGKWQEAQANTGTWVILRKDANI